MVAAPKDGEERAGQLDRAIASVRKGGNPDLLRARGIASEDGPFDDKLAFVFTGQGSQYLDMGLDLAEAYPVVAETFREADRVLTDTLGKPITDFIRLAAGEDRAHKEDVLRQTEYSQPATLTLDVAILRLLAAYGVVPDIVAGHSLGEYGAAVAAGVMTFEQALLAVSARGRGDGQHPARRSGEDGGGSRPRPRWSTRSSPTWTATSSPRTRTARRRR